MNLNKKHGKGLYNQLLQLQVTNLKQRVAHSQHGSVSQGLKQI